MLVPSFLIVVLRCVRMVLFTGFIRGEPWSSKLRQAPILHHFGQANIPRRLVSSHDESTYFAFALHNNLPLRFTCWVQVTPYFSPRKPIEGQSLPWGRGLSWFTQGWDLAFASPNIDYQVVKVQNFAPRPPCRHGFEGTGRTLQARAGT